MLNTIRLKVIKPSKRQIFLIVALCTFLITGLHNPAQADTLKVPGDFKTIQAAINAANSGDTIIVAPGTYKERITLKPNITLKSAGQNNKANLGLKRAQATIIDGQGKTKQGPGVAMAQGATLDGFTITNVGLYDDAKWKKHHATHGNNQSHEHIGQPGTPGIEITGVTCTVTNNIVHHIGYTGIAIMGAKNKQTSPLILNNITYRNMGGGIGSMKQSTAIIQGNICFQNFYAGIGHNNASPLIINNTCYENIRAGIGISEGSKPIVRANKCYRNRRAGIGIRTYKSTQPIIEDNDCYENDMAGIGNRNDAQPIIRNNRCYKNKMAGIGSRNGAKPIIVDNECYENELAGIAQRNDAHTIIMRNFTHHNKKAGIGFDATKNGTAIVSQNRVIDNALVAVGIQEGWNVQMLNNVLSRKGGMPPIVMVHQNANVTFTGNTIKGSGVAGIRTAGHIRVNNNHFIGTSLRKGGPPNFAVWGLPGANITFSGNNVSGWRHAISANNANVTAYNNNISNYWQAGIAVNQPAAPPHIFNNTFHSKQNHPALNITGQSGFTKGNIVKQPKQ